MRRLPTAAVLSAAAALILGCSACSGTSGGGQPVGSASPYTPPIAGTSAPRAPAQGAVLGAWVQPKRYTEDGRMVAVRQYQAALGHDLGLIQNYHTWDDPFPSAFDEQVLASGSTLLLSWSGTDTRQIASGQHDALIRQRALALKALGKPVLLRWRWEMDRPNLAGQVHSPADYVAAWRHIRAIFSDAGVTNVGWVWCPIAEGFDSGAAPAYYPGDDEVDWLCTDAYADDPTVPFARVAGAFLTWAKGHDKPIVLGEVGTLGGSTGGRAGWLAGLAATVRGDPQIKAVVYFDSTITRHGKVLVWSLRGSPEDFAGLKAIASQPYFQATLGPH